MSYEQPPDDNLIEQTRRQIQTLVGEISQLARQNMAPGQFYGEFLNRVVSALAAIGGVVWTKGENGQLALQYQLNLQQTGLIEDEEKQKSHSRLLYKLLNNPEVAGGSGALVPPHSGFGDDEAANPTEFLLVFGPLRTDLEMVGLVEIFQRAEAAPQVQQGYLRFLVQMCELAGDFLKSHQLRHFSDRQVLWARLEDFTRSVHSSLEPQETAYTIANEARRLIECDRVSVAIRKGNRCTIEAISGQDLFDKRSNTVRLLGRLASAVVATGEPVWYAGDTRDLAPQVEDAVQEYVDDAHSKMIAVLPLGRPKPDEDADEQEKDDAEGPVGALIVEQIEDNRVAPAMAQRIDVVCRHSSVAMANAMEHQSLFLMPLWRAIGKSKFIVQARTLPKTIMVAIASLVLIVLLCVWPADFDLHAKGTLEPVNRKDVYAGIGGQIDEFGLDTNGKPIEHGSWVKKGQILLRLRDPTLNASKAEADGKVIIEGQHVRDIRDELAKSGQLKPVDRAQLEGQLAEAEQNLKSLQAQAEIVNAKVADLELHSPIDGQIVTWDVKNRLEGRPVQQGQALLRVANPNRDWELDLHMSEDHMGHIARAKTLADERHEQLPVAYILATEPGTTLKGTVKEIKNSAEIQEKDEGNVVVIKVAINKLDIDPANVREGATVTGKVHCGRRSLGYVWFHDLLAFIQAKVFFRFF
ncbi:MAG: efflux RND transporter periplasmic adaptor subunit [Thermoguttaceae bacterium]